MKMPWSKPKMMSCLKIIWLKSLILLDHMANACTTCWTELLCYTIRLTCGWCCHAWGKIDIHTTFSFEMEKCTRCTFCTDL